MKTEHHNDDTSDNPKTDRTDEELRNFRPSRVTPMPDRWPAEQAKWSDYDFNSLDEFVRWSNVRMAQMLADAQLPHIVAKRQRIGDK